jgi:hypothetical protein
LNFHGDDILATVPTERRELAKVTGRKIKAFRDRFIKRQSKTIKV